MDGSTLAKKHNFNFNSFLHSTPLNLILLYCIYSQIFCLFFIYKIVSALRHLYNAQTNAVLLLLLLLLKNTRGADNEHDSTQEEYLRGSKQDSGINNEKKKSFQTGKE